MSSFLVNLVRRGAGLPATTIQAPPLSPFGPEIRKHGDGLAEAHVPARGLYVAEEPTTRNAPSQAPLRASPSEEYKELPSEALTNHTPSIQRLSGTEPGTPIEPSIGKPAATIRTPSLGSTPAPQRHVVPHGREAQVAPMEPPQRLGPTVPPFHADREVITEIEVERGRHIPSPAAQEIEPVGEPPRHASRVAVDPPVIIGDLAERQILAPAERSVEPSQVGAQKTRETVLPAPTIRPAPAESHTLIQFPKTTPSSSPTPPSQLPIHVRIGRVEVRATTAPTPTPARPSSPAPLGFDSYYRVRNYRS